ncbi:Putative ribonuclease H protein At1g65750, partial [Linum perenne]
VSLSQYWQNIFLLPKAVIKSVEKKCSDFLWGVDTGVRKRAKVSWKKIAKPKAEGGLDIKDMSTWNIACVARHIWSILCQAGSLWVAWIRCYRLKGADIWQHKSAPYHPWVWRRIMKVRKDIQPYITWRNNELNWEGLIWLNGV